MSRKLLRRNVYAVDGDFIIAWGKRYCYLNDLRTPNGQVDNNFPFYLNLYLRYLRGEL